MLLSTQPKRKKLPWPIMPNFRKRLPWISVYLVQIALLIPRILLINRWLWPMQLWRRGKVMQNIFFCSFFNCLFLPDVISITVLLVQKPWSKRVQNLKTVWLVPISLLKKDHSWKQNIWHMPMVIWKLIYSNKIMYCLMLNVLMEDINTSKENNTE